MKLLFAGAIGGWELILIFAVILLLFGARKLPDLARGLGQAIKEFRKASREVTNEITTVPDEPDSASQAQTKPGQPAQNAKSGAASQPSDRNP